MNKLIEEFADVMGRFGDNLIKKICKTAPFDKTFKGRIVEKKNPRKYVVEIQGNKITATTHEDYVVGDVVWVKYPRNNIQNAFIVCKTF